MQVKCDCGSRFFIKVYNLDIPKYNIGWLETESAGIMCVNCKKVYTMAELEAEKSANIGSKELILSKWHE